MTTCNTCGAELQPDKRGRMYCAACDEIEVATLVTDDEPVCNGMIFKASINDHLANDGSVVYQLRLRPMKRLSCPGCEQCGYLADDLRETMACGCPPIIDVAKVDQGQLFRLAVTNISMDHETGYAEDWDYEFIPLTGESHDNL